jgi:hypothetical protein
MWQFGHSKYSRVVDIGFDQNGTLTNRNSLPTPSSIIVQNHVLVSSGLTIGIRHEAVCLKHQRRAACESPSLTLANRRLSPAIAGLVGVRVAHFFTSCW